MKRPVLRALVGAQTVLMVAFGWSAAYLGRDEFRLIADSSQARVPDRAASTATTEPGGLPAVRISAAAQRSVGIEVAQPMAWAGTEPVNSGVAAGPGAVTPLAATVADLQPLLELRGRLLAAQSELAAARAALAAATAERARVQTLFDDDRNASQRALDEARAAAATAAAKERGAAGALASSSAVARAAWGTDLAAALLQPGDSGVLAPLLAGKSVLLRVVLRSDDPSAAPALLVLQQGGRAGAAVTAHRLAAVPGDAASPGRHLLYLAPAAGLSAGMRIGAQALPPPSTRSARASAAVLVPATAVVWHAGEPWVYVREGDAAATSSTSSDDAAARGAAAASGASASATAPALAAEPSGAPADPVSVFRRRAVPDARRVDTQWLLPGFDATASVVVRGAQVLLSEELKSQIGDEND